MNRDMLEYAKHLSTELIEEIATNPEASLKINECFRDFTKLFVEGNANLDVKFWLLGALTMITVVGE